MRRDLDVGFIYTYEDQWMTPLVRSLAASAPGLRMRFLLLDNASERRVDHWMAEHADTEVSRNDRRLGYAANLNRILERSDARYVLLLNTDMFFDPRAACLAKQSILRTSFHSHALGQVAGLIHIFPSQHGNVIGQ